MQEGETSLLGMPKVAINGFGRIGRPVLKNILTNHPELEVVAINDLGDAKTLAHLLKYDTNYGIYEKDVKFDADGIIVDGKKIKLLNEKEIKHLPWHDLGVDIVIESSGVYTTVNDLKQHLDAGAKKVLLSAPIKGGGAPMYLLGVNADKYDPAKDNIVAMASCTTNALGPLVKILHENFEIENGFMNTVHAYTNDQRVLDLPHKDLRRSRAAAMNTIPTSTGAAEAIAEVFPELKGKLTGFSLRVPVSVVSIVDFVCSVKKPADAKQINDLFRQASQGPLKNILTVSDEPLVSSDFKGNPHSSILDSELTMVLGNLIKVVSWYDNESGYAHRLAEMASFMVK